MLETWLVAIVGGAAGSGLTLVARYAAIPSEVRHHDRQIGDIDRDLDRYAADEYTRLRNAVLPGLVPRLEPTHLPRVLIPQRCWHTMSASRSHGRCSSTATSRLGAPANTAKSSCLRLGSTGHIDGCRRASHR